MRRQIIVDCGRRYRRMLAEGEFTRRKTSHALGPSRNSCSKMLLSSLFFGAGCWLCLFSPFRTDHRKQLRSRSVATQQRLRTNSFTPHRGAPTPLIPHTYVLLWACNRLRRCGTNIGKIMMTVRLTCTFSSSGPV